MSFTRNLILAFLSLLTLISCSTKNEQQAEINEDTVFFCNAEAIDSSAMQFAEASGQDLLFQNTDRQSNKESFSGIYSCRLTPQNPYGFTTEISQVKPDDYIKVTAWRKSKNENGVIAIDGGNGFYTADKHVIETKNGWQKIFAEYFVPPNFESENLKIYVWNTGNDTVYFDDIEIHHKNQKDYPEFSNLEGLRLYLNEQDINALEQKRLIAYNTTILENEDDDYRRAILFGDNDFLDAEVRLKGDLMDHLQGNKWSFRIKLKQDFAWHNLRTFSVQNPATRYFLYEWAAHKLFDQEDVLTTRYGFVPVAINQKSLGIYAWEEHFEKQLVESRNRREGPILRFDETLFWKRAAETNTTGKNWDIDFFNAAQIIPFKEGKTSKDSLLSQQLVEGQKLLLQYKKRSRPISEIFNVEQLAKYYALIDITQAYHGFTWHNQRFYFNPVTCLLEPVAFDGYIENGIFKRVEEPVLSLLNPEKINAMNREELMLFQVFSDSSFNRNYIKYLEKYSTPDFINRFITLQKPVSDSLKNLIQQEFPYYDFSFDYLRQQAGFISNNLGRIKSNIQELGKNVKQINPDKFQKEYTAETNSNLMPFLVHAYYNESKKELRLLNYQNSDIKIVGANFKNQLPETFEPAPVLKAYDGTFADEQTISIDGKPTKILFSVDDELFETEVKAWKYSEEQTSRQLAMANSAYSDTSAGKIIFDGEYTFSTDVVIPESKEVIFMPGTSINLTDGAGFFCWSALQINGTKENPVKIYSSDHTAQGFNVLQTQNRSAAKYAEFSGLSSLHRGGWQTPAAVNFYEADVDFENCIFASNFNCDDALNVVRSDFYVTGCRFENTFADAFDSDFCTGKVENCTFKNTGNDAIDFSGSQVTISSCEMTEISDKAISGGENSRLLVSDCIINKASIGVAAKDLSVLKLKNIELNQIVYGLVAFQKKPEFGSAKIIIDNLKIKKYIDFHQIEEGSVLRLNGKTIYGRERKLALTLYQ